MSGVCPDPHECLPEARSDFAQTAEPPATPDEYRNWDHETSFVISGPVPPNRDQPLDTRGGRVMTREEARRWVHKTYAVVGPVPEVSNSRRWAWRVLKPTAPGGRYTPPAEDTLPERARRK